MHQIRRDYNIRILYPLNDIGVGRLLSGRKELFVFPILGEGSVNQFISSALIYLLSVAEIKKVIRS